MGCGTSRNSAEQPTAQAKRADDAAPDAGANTANGHHQGKPPPGNVEAQRMLQKQTSLGAKAITSSFVVSQQKRRHRKRESDTGNPHENGTQSRSSRTSFPELKQQISMRATFRLGQDEFGVGVSDGFQLPAENAPLAVSSLVATSAPSFKAPRAPLLAPQSAQTGAKSAELEQHRAALYSSDNKQVLAAVAHVRDMLTVAESGAAVRQAGLVPRLVQLLGKPGARELQYEAAWALTNLASGSHEDAQECSDQGAVPALVTLLGSTDDELVEQAIWALGNIAADCTELQRSVLDEGVVLPLLGVLRRCSTKGQEGPLRRTGMWLLSNLCRPRPQDPELLESAPLVHAALLTVEDTECVTHACWALAYLTCEESASEGVGPDVLAKLVEWVNGASTTMTTPALRCLGNLCSGSSDITQSVVNAGGVPAVLTCLRKSQRPRVQKECCWILSNIAAGTGDQVQALCDAGAFRLAVSLMASSPQEEGLRRECAFVLANPWSAGTKTAAPIVAQLMEQGVIDTLVGLLDRSTPASILGIAVEGLQDAIKRGQQFMMWSHRQSSRSQSGAAAAAAASESGTAATATTPAPSNPVSQRMKELGAVEKLQSLTGVDEAVDAMLNSIINMLKFV